MRDVIGETNKVVIDFFSKRCLACKNVNMIIEKLEKEYDDITFLKVDVHEKRDLAKRFGVIALPVLVFLKDGREVERLKGARSEKEIREFIERNR